MCQEKDYLLVQLFLHALHFAEPNVRFKMFLLLFSVDQIYHLASPASPPNYMYNPIKTIKTNTIGTLNMLGKYIKSDFILGSRGEKGFILRRSSDILVRTSSLGV